MAERDPVLDAVTALREIAAWAEEQGFPLLERLLAERGETYEWSPRPDDVEPGKMKECFGNALHLALERGWKYAEGYVFTAGLPHLHHAWVVTPDGIAVDPTLREPRDSGTCGFCLGDGTYQKEIEWDEDGEACDWEEDACEWCDRTGKDDHEHPSREGTVYIGCAFDPSDVVRIVIDKGTYGLDHLFERALEECA